MELFFASVYDCLNIVFENLEFNVSSKALATLMAFFGVSDILGLK
jgi:hypothetical protein